jgi:hypothetical protein
MDPLYYTAPLIFVGAIADTIYRDPEAVLASQAMFAVLAAIGHVIVLRCRRNGRAA